MYVLVVDDDVLSLELAKFVLHGAGYEVEGIDSPRGALHMIERRLPHLLLLDVNMPEMDGFAFAERLKEEGYTIPHIFVTARTSLEERIRGFALDAEDYICKPFYPQELLARVQVVARHQDHQAPVTGHLRVGSMELVPEYSQVVIGSSIVALTPREMHILSLLMSHPGQVVKRELFYQDIWHEEMQSSNSLDVFIRRVRKKLKGKWQGDIVCVRTQGYKLVTGSNES